MSAPFAIYNFNRVAIFGLLANLAAVPVMAMWVMPWAMIAYLRMPFGLESAALAPMGWRIDVILYVARTVSVIPGSVALVPSFPMWGLTAIALGGLWLCLWRRRWRLLGLPVIALGLASAAVQQGPDILVDDSGRLFAIRDAQGSLRLSSRRAARFTADQWLRRTAQRESGAWPIGESTGDRTLLCDVLGCVYRANGHIAAADRGLRSAPGPLPAMADTFRLREAVACLCRERRPYHHRRRPRDGAQ